MTYDNLKKKSLLKYNAILASYNSLGFFYLLSMRMVLKVKNMIYICKMGLYWTLSHGTCTIRTTTKMPTRQHRDESVILHTDLAHP